MFLFLFTTVALYLLGGYRSAKARVTISKFKNQKTIDALAYGAMHGATWSLFVLGEIHGDIVRALTSKN